MVTLGNAARTLGITKSSVSKAISRGHLSATKRDDGSFNIDPAELARWWDGAKHRFQGPAPGEGLVPTHGENGKNGVQTPEGSAVDVRAAVLEAENRMLREQAQELRADRDAWRSTAERLLIAAPIIPAAPRRSWWGWWRAG